MRLPTVRLLLCALAATAAAGAFVSCGGGGGGAEPPATLQLSVLSSPSPAWVSGGDLLLRVGPAVPADAALRVTVDGRPVDVAFEVDGGSRVGLVTDLKDGANTLVVDIAGGPSATLQVTNHPRTGPLFSGPQVQPFACETVSFVPLPDGVPLGPPRDAACSVDTRVDYVYRTASLPARFVVLPDRTILPADVERIDLPYGQRVPFVVRLETGTLGRAIYQTALLHDPTGSPAPTPVRPSPAWSGRLIYNFGGGCPGGWYRQGAYTAGVLDPVLLARGHALASSTLNVSANNCLDVVAAEAMAMVKERFIEAYGRPRHTIGWGCSGGAYQQFQIADNYPGLLDGLLPGCSFPEVGVATVQMMTDLRLLGHYFRDLAPGAFTPAQQRAVAGVQTEASITTPGVYDGALRIAPDAFCPEVLPMDQRYDPVLRPQGVRCGLYDAAIAVWGRDPATGFARRPLDNVGVTYGRVALQQGAISVDQFLDLNERIGGYDPDGRFQAGRHAADPIAVRTAYETGRLVHGGGLRDVPIVDYRVYLDDVPTGEMHLRYHSFALRERLVRNNGDAGNHVMWVEDARHGAYASGSPLLVRALDALDRWLAAIGGDGSNASAAEKVRRHRPSDLRDGCSTRDAEPVWIDEPLHPTDGACALLYPSPPGPRVQAGGPLRGDVIQCALLPADAAVLGGVWSDAQRARLQRVFPAGVCDDAAPGVGQRPPRGTWLTYGSTP